MSPPPPFDRLIQQLREPACDVADRRRIRAAVLRRMDGSRSRWRQRLAAATLLTAAAAAAAWGLRPSLSPPVSGARPPTVATARPVAAAPEPSGGRTWAAPIGQIARPADAFVDSIGVNVRLREYPQKFSVVRDRLAELGVRHVADHFRSPHELLARLGPRVTLYVGAENDAHALARRCGDWLAGIVFMTLPRSSADWVERQRAWMTASHGALRADPFTRSLAIIGPTVSQPELRAALGDLSSITDAGGMGSPSWTTPPGGAVLDGLMESYRATLYPAAHPLIVPHALYAGGGVAATSLPEAHQARYLTRSYLENWRRGIARTYGSHLIDTGTGTRFEDALGMVRVDGTAKRAFHVVRDLIALLADPGPPYPPHALPFTLGGDTRDLGSLLLDRRDGRMFLVLWLAVPADDPPLTRSVTLTSAALTRVQLHRLADGAHPLAVPVSRGQVSLLVTEEPFVVQIDPPP